MLKRYRLFGMKQNPRGYKVQLIREMMDIGEILENKSAIIFDLSNITEETDRVERVAFALDQVLEYFDLQDDSDNLRLLIVLEEAHL